MATVLIPAPLRAFTKNLSKVEMPGGNVSDIISNLVDQYPQIQRHLLEPGGEIRSFINVFVDEDDIRNLQKQDTKVSDRSVISLIPAIAGGNINPLS